MTPGAYLKKVLSHRRISKAEAARLLKCSKNQVFVIISGKRNLTPKMCIRLSQHFGLSPQAWYRLQQELDMQRAMKMFGKAKK